MAGQPKVKNGKSASRTTDTVLYDYKMWVSAASPKWHGVKKMRYVFWRMMNGCTVRDALDELHWNPAEFWHLVDLKRNAPFLQEYKRAQTVQARSFSDSVVQIAEGRDTISVMMKVEFTNVIRKLGRKALKADAPQARALILRSLNDALSAAQRDIVARNKVQIDAAKWIAKTASPREFGDKLDTSIHGTGISDPVSVAIQFVDADGKTVQL